MTFSVLIALSALSFVSVSYASDSLPRSDVTLSDAIRDAQTVARMNPKWSVMLAEGTSMLPHYGDGSVLLVDAIRYTDLRPGMMAVFRDASGDIVGHFITGKKSSGWLTQGYRNASADPTILTQNNYIGVIFGVFNSNGKSDSYASRAQTIQTVLGKRL